MISYNFKLVHCFSAVLSGSKIDRIEVELGTSNVSGEKTKD